MSWSVKDSEFLLPAYTRLPLTVIKGEGCHLYDEENKKYLDMFAGVGVNQLGYDHQDLNNALLEQAKLSIHLPFHFYNPIAIEYAELLSNLSIKGKVFFTTSGAEATEAAIKMLHKYKKRTNDNRNSIVVFKNSFHGRTLGAITFTRQPKVYQDYPCNGFNPIEIEPNCIDELFDVIKTEKPIAFLMEPVLGSGGITPITDEFMRKAKDICQKTNTLLIMDEIQSGFGRTGTFFSYQSSEIEPDCILFGKGAGGGISLGGVIAGKKLVDTYKTGDHGTTWANPPLATALGLTVIKTLIKQNLIDSEEKSNLLFNGLNTIKSNNPHLITEIRHKGLMFGISTNLSPELAKLLQLSLMKNGVLIDIIQQNIIRLLPPLIISILEINEFLETFHKTILQFQKKYNLNPLKTEVI